MLEFWCQTRSKKITKARWVWRGGQDSLEPSSVPAYYITWSFLCPTWMIIRHLSPKGYSGRFFFFRTDKGKTPQSVMFWGCGTDSLLPPQSSRFSWALSENKHETRKCENPQCFRLPMRTAYSKEIESWYRAITECVRSHLPNQWSFRSHKYKAFFFFLSFSSFALQEERDGDKRNYSDWRLGCHRRSVLIAVAVTVLLCTNN